MIKVRYRFVTSEVPGGYFGTRYNDYFSVSIRSQGGSGNITESNSMNGLGLGAFDASGATAWRDATLNVSENDVVQVDITVANVADGLLDSHVIVDFIEESTLKIESVALRDIDDSTLLYLSSSEHSYFNGQTRVHGTISVTGDKEDGLQSLELEVVQGGGVVATGQLASGAQGALIKSFGDAGKVELGTSQLLFEIDPAGIDDSTNGTVELRVKAQSTKGETATKTIGSVQILARYTGNNRYGGRDAAQGGDDWVKPSVKTVTEAFGAINWGDFSNMNGGRFAPHASHNTGNDVDGHFAGYNARDAATANTMIGFLNDPTYGSQITLVFVTYARTPTDPFWNAIMNVTLADGRAARDVIQPVGGHGTHFHWRIAD